MFNIKKNTIDDYLGWNKLIVGINSSAILAIFFKDSLINQYQYAAYCFICSLLSILLFSLALIEHRNSKTDILNKKYSSLFVVSWASFLIAFVLLII